MDAGNVVPGIMEGLLGLERVFKEEFHTIFLTVPCLWRGNL